MSAGSAKQKVLEVIEKLPPDATLEDAIGLCSWRRPNVGWWSWMLGRASGWLSDKVSGSMFYVVRLI